MNCFFCFYLLFVYF
ncbi:hypothetical protein DERP_008786 [Dermatophagoides pteronyssinus]|uniref:Uncharacterized protein n=1 Tax=Dermatophagoides pteronyssinus TaxID=6956 RepID=A0ABQ8IWB4_DERPT|nr:hypothetical protein DERP_008786 [Dermatophagoides pteronyssinus]